MRARYCEAVLMMVFLAGCVSTAQHREVRVVLALQQQAEVAYAQGDMTQALNSYRVLLDEMPDDNTIWFRLGNIYARLDQPQDAVAAYQQVLQSDALHAKAWHNLGVMLLRQAQEAFSRSEQTVRGDDMLRERSKFMVNAIAGLRHPEGLPAASDPAEAALDAPGATP